MDHILACHEIIGVNFVRGRNCYLYDTWGQKYTDFESGIWCTALGHSDPRIAEVMRAQTEKITHLGTRFPNLQAEEAAVEVLQVAGMPNGKCVFLSSGSEAVEFGVQAARRISGKPLLLTFATSYLAAYGSAGRKSADEWYLFDWEPCANCLQEHECDANCGDFGNIPFDRIGGFVFEPGSASGRVRFPPRQIVQALVNRVRQHGGLIVANEVTTGMGRTGKWFGFQHYEIQPDVVALGKGLGNGYPVSAIAMGADVASQLEKSEFRYAQSHQNDPLGCSIAKTVIKILRDDGLIARGNELGERFQEQLRRLSDRHDVVKGVRGRGMMIAMEFDGRQGDLTAAKVCRELLKRRLIVGCYPAADLLRFDPALTIGEEDISGLTVNLGQILRRAEA